MSHGVITYGEVIKGQLIVNALAGVIIFSLLALAIIVLRSHVSREGIRDFLFVVSLTFFVGSAYLFIMKDGEYYEEILTPYLDSLEREKATNIYEVVRVEDEEGAEIYKVTFEYDNRFVSIKVQGKPAVGKEMYLEFAKLPDEELEELRAQYITEEGFHDAALYIPKEKYRDLSSK